ncbi:MAG: hypothetical protein AB1403_04450 [Candidatus Riflebacteria bacterium]
MKKLFLLLFILATVSLSAEPYIDQMGDLVEEISLLNVLRGMYLTRDQAHEIARLTAEAEKIRNDALKEIKALDSIQPMTQLRDELYTALAEDPPKIREKVVELDNAAHEITGRALDRIARMEEEIKKILSPGQQDIFWEFIPCIVPEVDFENPVRTGQAAASSRLMPALELVRNTPNDMWEKHGQAFVDHVLKITENEAGKMTDDVREDLRRRLVKHCWKIRSMKEADFMINKSKLAEELLLINREHTQRSGFRTTGKLARFFLSPAAARVLPKWLEIHFGKESKMNETPKIEKGCVEGSQSDKKIGPLPEKATDKDQHFWEVQVPQSLARLAETPYYDHVHTAFPKAFSKCLFDENDRYIDKENLINEAAMVFLKREGKLKFYSETQGEP